MGELIDKAKSAIGTKKPDDYKINPTVFPDTLKDKTPELAGILKNASFSEKARRYEEHNETAISNQRKYKLYALQATWGVAAATISGSLLAALSLSDILPLYIRDLILLFLGFISTIGGGMAIFRLNQMKSQKLLELWMSSRAQAETERLGYFRSLGRYIIQNKKSDIYLNLLYMCFFKRYQLDIQLLYYGKRHKDHRKSFEVTSMIGAVAALCLAFGSGILGMIGSFLNDLLPLAALGTIGAAISAVASRREEINQDERNAERYLRTADILSKLTEKYDDILIILENGKQPIVMNTFVEAVNDQLSLEHRQWTKEVSEMSTALASLEQSVSELQKEKT